MTHAKKAVGRGKYEQKRKRVSYRAVLNICLSFLNEVKNLAKNTGVKYAFYDYSMPDSSLRVILYSFLLSSFRICPPLKNDGRGELRFSTVLTDFLYR